MASSQSLASSSSQCLASSQPVSDSPHQPRNISYPKIPFGKSKVTFRSFNPAWCDKWQWFCFTCMVAYKQKKLIASPKGYGAFIQKGFQN